MFERYTEKARRVLFFARYEASQFGAHAIEAEHILLGILREDKILVEVLFPNAHTAIDSIRHEIESRTITKEKIHASVDLPLSPAAKRTLSYAADESEKLHSRHIGTEHLLLGLIRDESIASELLIGRGVTAAKVIDFIGSYGGVHIEQKGDALSFDAAKTAERLSQPLWLLVDMLARKGVLTREEFMGELLGKGASISVLAAFNRLLDLLVSKDIISAEERREISTGQS